MAATLISTDTLDAGGVLAASVQDGHGNILLAKGSVLSADAIASLCRRGVQSVMLVSSLAEPEPDAHVLKEKARLRLQVLFRHTVRGNLVNPLLHIVPRYRAGEAS